MEELGIRANGKINLGLDVLGRRANGYHDLRMVMQTVSLADDITLTRGGRGLTVTTNVPELPGDERNLAYRAAALLRTEFHLDEGLQIRIEKRIPLAAGMAGGSADAAAVLQGVNELFELGLSTAELQRRGLTLGADVPYCLAGGTMLAEGIGEVLSDLPPLPDCVIALAKPPVAVSTRWVYAESDRCGELLHPPLPALLTALRQQDLMQVAANLGNALEQVTIARYPVIADIKQTLREFGALGALMTGSGPTVFGLFTAAEPARAALAAIAARGLAADTHIARAVNRSRRK